jgi:hypothetical protein
VSPAHYGAHGTRSDRTVPLCHRPTPSSARCPASGCRGWTSVCPMAASRHELASLDGLGFCVVRLSVSPEGWTMTSRPGTLRRCLGLSIRMLARDQFRAGSVMAGGQGGRLGLGVPETDGSAGARSTPAASRSLESSPKGGMEARRSSKSLSCTTGQPAVQQHVTYRRRGAGLRFWALPAGARISRVSRRVLLAKSRSAAPVRCCCRAYVDWSSGNVAGIRSVSFLARVRPRAAWARVPCWWLRSSTAEPDRDPPRP